MAVVYLTCGKICSGKSTFARKLAKEKKAVILSCDELTKLFPSAENHEAVLEKVEQYLLTKMEEIINCGINVILDWGFWTKQKRTEMTVRLEGLGIPYEWYYIKVSDSQLRENIKKRNSALGKSDYFVDDGLLNKCLSIFEEPDEDEMNNLFKATSHKDCAADA